MKEEKIRKERSKEVLAIIPLDLDGSLFDPKWDNRKKQHLTSRLAANFVGWEKDHALFDRELEKVVQALRADDGGREKPPQPRL